MGLLNGRNDQRPEDVRNSVMASGFRGAGAIFHGVPNVLRLRCDKNEQVPAGSLTVRPENGWARKMILSFWDSLFSGANC